MTKIVEMDRLNKIKHDRSLEISKIIDNDICGEVPSIERFIEKKIHGQKIAIYGAGQMGRFVLSLLKDHPVDYFLDINSEKLINVNGTKVLYPKPDAVLGDVNDYLVIVAVIFEKESQKDEVYDLISNLGYKNVMNISDFWYFHESGFYSEKNTTEKDYYLKTKSDILNVFDLLADENSIEVYHKFLKAVLLHDANEHAYPIKETIPYFVDDVPFKKGFNRFIECGALDGNTIRDLTSKYGKIEKLAIFEPDAYNFKVTADFIRENADKIADEINLYPCAVWSTETRKEFSENCMGASRISENGTSVIQCMAIDNALLGYRPTCIKMDIEGAEYEALLGAKMNISVSKPDLAICAYHKLDHIWELANLINSWNLGYEFYFRSHACFGFGATLYAVTK